MRRTLRLFLWVFAGVLVAAGCKQADRAISASPTRAELFTLKELEPTLAVSVGVEGARAAPRVVLVPKYEEIALTPEEREALGEEEEPELDALAFYRLPRGPQHGVSPGTFAMSTAIGGVGGALVGCAPVYPRGGTYGFGGRYAFEHHVVRLGAGVGRPRGRVTDVGRHWLVLVGDGPLRQPARRAPRTGRKRG